MYERDILFFAVSFFEDKVYGIRVYKKKKKSFPLKDRQYTQHKYKQIKQIYIFFYFVPQIYTHFPGKKKGNNTTVPT